VTRLRQGFGGQARRPRQGSGAQAPPREGSGGQARDLSAARGYATALALLARREISATALRARLLRRGFAADDVDDIVTRLQKDGTLDDRRTATAAARLEGAIRLRGRRRVLQKVRSLGVDAEVAHAAVDSVFADIDETALLDRAIAKRLKGENASPLDRAATARLVRSLVGQGFAPEAIFKRLRARHEDHEEG
jgi:regulatory protein